MDKRLSDNNQLNDLNGKEWVSFTKSWFISNPPPRENGVTLHPAKFPETMVYEFVKFFTRHYEKDVILDPFCGTGSTMVAIDRINHDVGGNRQAIGIELNSEYANIARKRTSQLVLTGDASKYDVDTLPMLDFIITSPPYWNILHKKSGHINAKRNAQGLDVVYSDSKLDIGNIQDYGEFITTLVNAMTRFTGKLKSGKFCVIILSCTNKQGKFYPIPYDFAREFEDKSDLEWKGEKIWCQDNKKLMPYGYPYSFVPNFTHHSCLVFRQKKD